MKLVYKFQYKPNKKNSILLSSMTYASARLFNVGNYERHNYKELGFDEMPDWYDQKKRLKDNQWFKALPAQTSQDILQRLDEGWKSYLKLLKTKGIVNPEPPYYKPKGGHFNIKYLNNSFKIVGNRIRFMISKNEKEFLKSKFNLEYDYFYIKLKKEISNIKQIEFRYINDSLYDVFIVYEVSDNIEYLSGDRCISIDLGINNLATIYDNKGKCFIISGNSYLNTLFYYNKRIAHYQSILTMQTKSEKSKSKRLNKLYKKKKNIISYILHKATRIIVKYCRENNVSNVIIGDITGIREDNDKGPKVNQKLHSLPYQEFYQNLSYKLKQIGIKLIYQNEAFTSSCPLDSVNYSKEYQTKGRIKRGLFMDENIVYNSDCVGAYNIMRKYKLQNDKEITMLKANLSNPKKISICVTSSY